MCTRWNVFCNESILVLPQVDAIYLIRVITNHCVLRSHYALPVNNSIVCFKILAGDKSRNIFAVLNCYFFCLDNPASSMICLRVCSGRVFQTLTNVANSGEIAGKCP